MRKFLTTFLLAAVLLLTGGAGRVLAQVPHARNGEMAYDARAIRRTVDTLCGPACDGRRTGTPGGKHAAGYLASLFRKAGLKPLRGSSFELPFHVSDGVEGRNVAGIYPGRTGKYVVIGAHYDHLGRLDGTLYPGADKNASGTAALVGLAGMVRKMLQLGKTYDKGLIVVAFDAKEMNLAGSSAFVQALKDGTLQDPSTGNAIHPRDISLMINLDILGSTLSPPDSGREDYLIALTGGESYFSSHIKARNKGENFNLELLFDYYGSSDFTRLFYRRVSDQKAFLESGIPAVMFTSGITMNTNKPADTPATLDYAILKRRILLIYYFLVSRL